ncbi:MAG: prephenate dehydrogenase [Candidatus Limnocylindrales bacterium]
MRVALLGLGLIGGSIARALAAAGGWHVVAWSRTREGPRRALAEGIVAAVAERPDAAVAEAELVVLAAPPLANLALVRLVGPAVAAHAATLTDVSSAKAAIAARAAELPELHFVGGHPMSGRETAGYGSSEARLFVGRPWVLVPGPAATASDVARVRGLAEACGARPVLLTAEVHDRAVAAISHLPLLASAALASSAIDSDDWPVAAGLAAQGWRDVTRLARGEPALGAGILATNAVAIAARLRRYRAELAGWQTTLDGLAVEGEEAEGAIEQLTERLARIAAALQESGAPPRD